MYCDKTAEQVFDDLTTGHEGLTEAEADRRFQEHGPNSLEKEKQINLLKLVLDQFTDPLIYILIIAAIVTALLNDFVDTAVIFAVIIINAIVGFTQEYNAARSIDALKTLTAPVATVIREGHIRTIDGVQLVPGDVVLLSSGSRVPADLRLIEVIRLEADESALTGESVPVRKTVETIPDSCPSLMDAGNMAFMGSLIRSGRGTGIVIATGRKTQLGQISSEVAHVKSAQTPLEIKLKTLSRNIGIAVLGISFIVVVLGILVGETIYQMLLTGIALAVGAIPEGMPIVITITLAIGVKRMAGRNAIMRKLPAVETLGSTTVIASDKTGTMTRNEMTVVRIFAGNSFYRLTGTGFYPVGEILPETGNVTENRALEACLRAGLLANESSLERKDSGDYKPVGDPTEVSLIVSAMKGNLEEGKEMIDYVWIDEIPFESDLMYMAALYRDKGDHGNISLIKGAPDRISGMCNRELSATGEEIAFNDAAARRANDEMGSGSLRVLAMAYKRFPAEVKHLESGMISAGCVFLGLQGMYDPPREEVSEAIRLTKSSGIRVIMVTGDYRTTAVSIARKLGIIPDSDRNVITGDDMDKLTDADLYELVGHVSVFSRVSPLHKLRIVQQLIKRNEVVAVTGDGVNDTPALKAAHIGVAMGKSGTDAAKETANMVIADDNFASIMAAVKEGRVVFANIRKVVLFLLSSGLGQIILILLTIIIKLPLPLLPAQIIWMNLVTNGLQDIAMSFEPAEKGIENQPPRKRDEPVISRLMAERLVLIGIVLGIGTLAVFIWQLQIGASIEKARTMALTTMVMYQLFNVFNARSETSSVFAMNPFSNRFLFFSIVLSVITQVAVIYWAPMAAIFSLVPLTLHDWAVLIPVALTVVLVVEIEKQLRKLFKPVKNQ